ncbi:DNA-3-methyladenine glycosylase I [Shouchella lonarensis]|uniref:DNA-3-methyladenine glycosylase I n=1 Tax=Shouchella lonarensis TaxID=1464122 RepID=A0A1G6P7M2_9BACI|nr:DNA-3-methyladenine glycosylase I [Shouchella lonarensis]
MCTRCSWVTHDPLYKHYHDHEWGKKTTDDRLLFEQLMLEAMQSGLSWLTILKKREGIREAFAQFNIDTLTRYTDCHVSQLLQNKNIIRHEGKIRAVLNNAHVVRNIQEAHESLFNYISTFISSNMNTSSMDQAKKMSRALKKHGMSFVGPTTCHSFMQSSGLINGHQIDCFLFNKSSP